MKIWSVAEVSHVVDALKPLLGLRLQEVLTTPEDVILGFYSSSGILWLWVDLNALSPCLLPWTDLPRRPALHKTPLQLFLRAHFIGKTLKKIAALSTHARVVLAEFEGSSQNSLVEFELRLIPHARNFIARFEGKSLAWQKPRELSEGQEFSHLPAVRSLEQLRSDWENQKGSPSRRLKKTVDLRVQLENDLAKKRKALIKVDMELAQKHSQPWFKIGTWLKTHQSLEVPREWELFVDKRRKLAWNIEQCFSKAREISSKILGTEKRQALLRDEIHALELRLTGPLTSAQPKIKKIELKVQAEARSLRLPGDMLAIAGKSAVDNLKILRQAKKWDLWFHLRDFPSSHAILMRNKNKPVSDKTVFAVIAWFVRLHFGQKLNHHVGEKIDVVFTECRHVHPIKGDRIGRVTFQNERVITYQIPP